MSKLIDLTGQRFGRLTVVKRADNYITPGGQQKTRWECQCDCGNIIETTATNLRGGITRSCGCYREELRKQQGHQNAIHGGFGTRIYRIYRGMWQRCYDKNSYGYERYGRRGIVICPEWLGKHGFETFRRWAYDNGYSEKLSIDRINNDLGYSPDNCRWATNKEQQNNRSVNVFLTYNGETHTMAEWADILGVPRATIKSRRRAGWSDADIITKPVDKRLSTRKKK